MPIETKLNNMFKKVERQTITRNITERENPPGHLRWLVGIPKGITDYIVLQDLEKASGTFVIRKTEEGNRVIDFSITPEE